jgi:hypothetical protein
VPNGHLCFRPGVLFVQEPEVERRPGARVDVLIVDIVVEGEFNIMRREGFAVVPRHALAQVKRPLQAVIRAFPGLGQRRLDRVGQP